MTVNSDEKHMVVCGTYYHRVSQKSIYSHLKQAAEAVKAAREESMSAETAGYLDGVEKLLTHHSDGAATGAEAMIYPTPGALDTVQSRLSDIIQETEGSTADNLQEAQTQIRRTILLLDERQSEGRPTSSWR